MLPGIPLPKKPGKYTINLAHVVILKTLWKLNTYFKRYKKYLFLGLVFVTLSNFFSVYQSRFVGLITDLAAGTMQENPNRILQWIFEGASGPRVVIISALCIFVLALLKGFFMFYMRQTIIVMSRHIEYDQKNDIFAHYQKLSTSFYKKHSTGDLMTRISEDVSKVRNYTGPAIMYFANLLVMFVITLTIMLGIDVKLTLIVLSPLPVMAILIYYINRSILKRSGIVQAKLSALSTFAQEAFSGIRVLKSFGITEAFSDKFAAETESYKKVNLQLVKMDALFFPVILLLIGLSTTLTIYVGGIEVQEGRISPGVIAEFIMYVNMLTWPTATLGWVTSIVQQAKASQLRIDEFLHTAPEITNPSPNEPFIPKGEIRFKNVDFTYEQTGITALKNIDFMLKPGQRLGITGRTGSGKTTLTQLLLRMFDVTGGQILIDGQPIDRINLDDYRRHIGYVPQEIQLFSDSIAHNIMFGTQDRATEQDIRKAAELAGVLHNIEAFPNKFDTLIGERGIKLSGGQKQRISIARALIKNPEILILDDCLSAVDAETEDIILANLDGMMKGRTSIFVSHRVSALRKADIVLVLDQGQIVQTGTPEELRVADGYYREIFNKQMGQANLV